MSLRRSPATLLCVVPAMLFLASIAPRGSAQEKTPDSRLILIGFDGLDHGITQQMMAAGDLPNFARLAERGTFRRLETTNPAQSPVAWSSMMTGLNPGKTGIDGFVRRDFDEGDMHVALAGAKRIHVDDGFLSRSRRRVVVLSVIAAVFVGLGIMWWRGMRPKWTTILCAVAAGIAIWFTERELPDGRPAVVNTRRGDAIWKSLDGAGCATCSLFAPMAFPAPHLDHGRLISGLGVPDALGTPGTWWVFRDDVAQERVTETGGRIKPLIYADPESGDGAIEPVTIFGPENIVTADGTPSKVVAQIALDREQGSIEIRAGHYGARLKEGEWSDPVPFIFRQSRLIRLRARSRFKALQIGGKTRVYLEPLGFDPAEMPPGIRLSHPDLYAAEAEFAARTRMETVGWSCATNPLKDGEIDLTTFLEDVNRVWTAEEKIARQALAERKDRFFSVVFAGPDRVQHMTLGAAESDGADKAQARIALDAAYSRADAFIGEVLDNYLHEGDALMVVSDHGFAPWRRSVNLNAWLAEEGLLVLKDRSGDRNVAEHLGKGGALDHVDWSKTRAYSIGLGKIYVNLVGREPQGIVKEDEKDGLVKSLREKLLALKDGAESVVGSVERGDDIYVGDAVPEGAADLYVGFRRGYRVSWQSCLLGVDEAVITDNKSQWGADHCSVDPAAVPGVILSTEPLVAGALRVVDVAPSVLAWFGTTTTPADKRDGRSILK